MHIVYNENCLETMKRMPDNSVDSIVTDPPYGLGEAPDPYEVMKSWIEHGYHEVKGKGFMAKEWDAFVPQPVIWKECFRILKPGGHLLAFSSTRTQDWMTMALRFAGFEINTSIYWVFASGMPKGLNVSKAIDKKYGLEREVVGKYTPPNGKEWNINQAADEEDDGAPGTFTASGRRTLDITAPKHADANKWEGWNSQLKPAVEPITVARKPMIGNIVDNVLKYGTGTFNVDACRVGTRDTNESGWSKSGSKTSENRSMTGKNYDRPPKDEVGLGRYPSNLIHDGSDDVIDLFPNTKSGAMKYSVGPYDGTSLTGMLRGRSGPDNQYGDEGSASRFFYCVATNKGRYPSNLIHDGSDDVTDLFPNTKSGKDRNPAKESDSSAFTKKGIRTEEVNYGDEGSAARFYYCAKAGNSDRNEGLDEFDLKSKINTTGVGLGNTLPSCPIHKKGLPSGSSHYTCGCYQVYDGEQDTRRKLYQNIHSTVKPTSLMRYLCRLVTPVGGLVYDPFTGSGSTGKAAILEGFEFVGSELDPEYTDIANARLKHALENKDRLADEYVLEHIEKVMPKKSGYSDNGYF